MEFLTNIVFEDVIATYPPKAKQKLLDLRTLIIETAEKEVEITKIMETTKWGEPSYVTKTGSTIRIDWKPKNPDHYYIYFICTTDLVNTFKAVFGDELTFEGNRAIKLEMTAPLPKIVLSRCVRMALMYHKLNHLPFLGA